MEEYLIQLAQKVKELQGQIQLLQKEQQVVQQQQGPKGEKGDRGAKGDQGTPGVNGKDGRDGKDGKDGEDGKDGVSVVDVTLDFDNSLSFLLSNGESIKTDSIEVASTGVVVSSLTNTVLALDGLAAASDLPAPTEVIVKQNDIWVRATLTQFKTW